jgi:hypothetical protein
VIGEKLAKPRQKSKVVDKGAPQFFYEIVQYWVTYDLVKIIAKYGLKPEFNVNLETWSKDIYNVVCTLRANKTDDSDDKRGKFCLDILYDTNKTVHWTNFGKCALGTRKHLSRMSNFALPLVLITWQRMLVEHFSENTNETFFEKGNYEPQKKANQNYPLNSLHLKGGGAKHADEDTQVSSFDQFTIKEKLSLENWADKILQQEAYFGLTNEATTGKKTRKTGDKENYSILDKHIKWEKDKDDVVDEVVEAEDTDMIEEEIVLDDTKRIEQLKTIAEAMNVGRTLLAKINKKTKEQRSDENTVNHGCKLLQQYIARDLKNNDLFKNYDEFMEYMREQKEVVDLVDDRSDHSNDSGKQGRNEDTEVVTEEYEALDDIGYSSSSEDEEERDEFLTDVDDNKITAGKITDDKDGDTLPDDTTKERTSVSGNNEETGDNEHQEGIDENMRDDGSDDDREEENQQGDTKRKKKGGNRSNKKTKGSKGKN